MPELSRFFGMVIAMFYRDHDPAHFHVAYGNFEATVNIKTGEFTGKFPNKGRALVLEWLEIHRDELLKNWELAKQRKPLNKIEPLE